VTVPTQPIPTDAQNGRAVSQTDTPALEVTDLTVTFPSEGGIVRAVRGVNYRLERGEVLGIVGESGSGKSVTAMAVLGLLPESAYVTGSVRLNGRELLGLEDRAMSKIRGRELAMVFQDPLSALTPVFSIGTQIVEALQIHQDISKTAARKRAIELLDLVGIPDPQRRVDNFPHEFSGGMRQRAMIAQAIANDPAVIIADEPTTALDVTIQAQILDVLKTAKEATGAAIVMITHDLGVVAGFADRVMVMYAGKPVETGVVDDIYYEPRMPYTIGLLGSIPRLDDVDRRALTPIEGNPPNLSALPVGCPFQDRCPIAVELCREVEPQLADIGDGRHQASCHRTGELVSGALAVDEVFPVPEIPQAPTARIPRDQRPAVLEVQGLHKHFPLTAGAIAKRKVGEVRAVDGIDLEIRSGETVGLVGESGCGKTTTLMQLLELVSPQQGRIVVLGQDTSTLSKHDRRELRRDVQVVFQDPMASLDPRMPVGAVLSEPLRAFGWPKDKIGPRVAELLKLVGLEPEHASRFPAEFSGGQRQRVGIARALAVQPKLVILDEPVSALDVSIQAGVINLLEELKAKLDLSYLFVAHDLSVVRHTSDRVAVMYLGRIVEVGDVDAIFDAPSHPYTQALLSAIPVPDPHKERERKRVLLDGDLPSPTNIPSGCRFRNRCPKFKTLAEGDQARCVGEDPALTVLENDHQAACHYAGALSVV
jgi:peptide/nickel transport system ATP-binding protein